MPIYEYTCGECERGFELLVRGSDRPACPHCGSSHLERRMSLPARPGGAATTDFSKLGPPGGSGGCGSGSCGCH